MALSLKNTSIGGISIRLQLAQILGALGLGYNWWILSTIDFNHKGKMDWLHFWTLAFCFLLCFLEGQTFVDFGILCDNFCVVTQVWHPSEIQCCITETTSDKMYQNTVWKYILLSLDFSSILERKMQFGYCKNFAFVIVSSSNFLPPEKSYTWPEIVSSWGKSWDVRNTT